MSQRCVFELDAVLVLSPAKKSPPPCIYPSLLAFYIFFILNSSYLIKSWLLISIKMIPTTIQYDPFSSPKVAFYKSKTSPNRPSSKTITSPKVALYKPITSPKVALSKTTNYSFAAFFKQKILKSTFSLINKM